ncbi:uncharacterized protein LOC131619086 [Vicia villosa]|uniref:uncharacterized protein LOC131619086 n=1 Tax=Vicia villosa TaxID=3911 RepID=UPI00273A7A8A|nr:uncharacterized protein LOC131619086 [Vicia villosa]
MQKYPNFHHHSKCKKLATTDLIFTDDVLLFCKGGHGSVEFLLQTITTFSASTCLIINPQKCKAYYGGKDERTKLDLQMLTKFDESILPFRYLGVPLSSKRLTIAHYLPLIDWILSKVKHWTSKLLSYAGRFQLVRSVSFAIAQFWMQCFPLPKFVIHKIVAIFRSLVWAGSMEIKKRSPVAWESVCKPKSDNLWVKWIHIYYLKNANILTTQSKPSWSWMMKGIMQQTDLIPTIQHTWDTMLQTEEIVDHLFFDCRVTKDIWEAVLLWLELDHIPAKWFLEIQRAVAYTKKKGWKSSWLKLALTEAVHEIWLHRNRIIFQQDSIANTKDRILEKIVYRGWMFKKIRSHLAAYMS